MRNIEPNSRLPGVVLLHVAVAAIINDQGQVLLSRRPDHVHQGGLWEFPGGKVEAGETTVQGLHREMLEELGVSPVDPRPLIRVQHHYPEHSVILDVWRVERWQGNPEGREGQQLEWLAIDKLWERSFPDANKPIIRALQLPDCHLITPEPGNTVSEFMRSLQTTLEKRGVRLVQLRAKQLDPDDYKSLAREVLLCCRNYGANLLLNGPVDTVLELGADGIHLSSDKLRQLDTRPIGPDYLVGASCHNPEEVAHAIRLEVDFIVVSPVHPTLSHPSAQALGWAGFAALCDLSPLPVYALGGMQLSNLQEACRYGGQGIAGIRGLWLDEDS